MYVQVRVVAGSKKELVVALEPNRYEIFVKEPAQQNLANRRVIVLVARALGVLPTEVRLISGHRSPSKVFSIDK